MNYYYIATGSLILIGLVVGFFLARRKSYRDPSAAEKYTEIRDKLTVREKPKAKKVEVEYDDGFNPFSFVAPIIMLTVTLFVGVTIMGSFQTSLETNSAAYNASNYVVEAMAVNSIISFLPMAVIAIMAGVILFSFMRFFGGGLEY